MRPVIHLRLLGNTVSDVGTFLVDAHTLIVQSARLARTTHSTQHTAHNTQHTHNTHATHTTHANSELCR